MTLEKILDDLTLGLINQQGAINYLNNKQNKKLINYFIHRDKVTSEPLTQSELSQLNAIVNILQIVDNSSGSPISDDHYDILQEMLIDGGIPRLAGTIEINDSKKESHTYKHLRGTLDKIYYLGDDEKRTNPSRKYLSEWIKRTERLYEKITGNKIDLMEYKIMVTPKFDGGSAVLEVDSEGKCMWLTRGDTKNNRASNVTHILSQFNDLYNDSSDVGIKFEIMMTEENKDYINEVYRDRFYKNSRQVVTSTLNSKDPDFKADYLYPVALRITKVGDDMESIHPDLITKFPSLACSLSDTERIREFANKHKYVEYNKMRFRTDGVVITLVDPELRKILGRDNDINNFEVAYKFTEEIAYTTVRGIEFDTSNFGFICPVLVVEDVVLKGNTINHISLSNKERFDELNLNYGDMVKVSYDIIPYVTLDDKCIRSNKKRVEFINNCPKCGSELDLGVVQVQCKNKNCPAIIIGRILNYCETLRIQNIGSQTLDALYNNGFLKNGIRSLYKLKKHNLDIEELDGFGRLKTRKIISEVEAKRRLKDYEVFGAIGIEALSTKTFKTIFLEFPYNTFIHLIENREFDTMKNKLLSINGIGNAKADALINHVKYADDRKELFKLLKELSIEETFGKAKLTKGIMVFSGLRPTADEEEMLTSWGWELSNSWTNKAKYLIIPEKEYTSSKVEKAKSLGIPVIHTGNTRIVIVLKQVIPNLM